MPHKLSLISAPAGFGKTTLVGEWIAESSLSAAWLSLDEGDSDPYRLLAYLVASFQTIEPGIGAGLQGVHDLAQPPPVESILTSLLNDISSLPDDVVLVFEDYHLIDLGPAHDAVAFLLEYLPPRLHLVITTREDPQFPLARMRARGEMIELRADDLRFTSDEATAFLSDVMGLNLSAEETAVLEARTEGWIAGLQLAALSMQGRDDVSGFLQAFAGDDRYIVDYLVEEVLQGQPGHIRDFLLQTSILDRLSGPLCDAVTARDDSRVLLEDLVRSNLFVVPLDGNRQWYRYHHLFAEVLRAHLMDEHPDHVSSLHQRASVWLEEHGDIPAAIRHAFAAGDSERAASLIERLALHMLGSSQEDTLWAWLEAIPDDLVRMRPVLSVYYGFASFSRAGLDAGETWFRDAERWLEYGEGSGREGRKSDGMVVVDEAAFRSLQGTIAVGRAYCAGARGDVDGIIALARLALDVLPESSDLWRGAASAVLGIGYWTSGELEPAYRYFAAGRDRLEAAGYTQFQIVSVHILADIRVAQGRLREARNIYEESLRLAAGQGDSAWGTTDLYVGLSELSLERNDLEAANRFLLRSREIGEHAGLMDTRHRWHVAMARVRAAQGALDDALQSLDEAERQYVPGADPVLRPVAALKAQIWLAQGRVEDAVSWVHEKNLSVDDTLSYLREFEHMTLARVLIARYRAERDDHAIDNANTLLERLRAEADRGERMGSVIEILVLHAIASGVKGDTVLALRSLERALSLAEPEGYVRIFVGEGAPMADLLSQARSHGIMPEYTHRLMTAFGQDVPEREVAASRAIDTPAQPLIEPLSPRELEVLHLVSEGLSNNEIAERLFLALSTVKGHNQVIFGKLGVQRRTEAVARARELGLL